MIVWCRRGIKLFVAMSACLTLQFFAALQSAADEQFFVKTERLLCVLDNSDGYLTISKDPIVINLRACPDFASREVNFNDAENTRGPKGIQRDRVYVSNLMQMLKSELRCIVTYYLSGKLKSRLSQEIVDFEIVLAEAKANQCKK